MILISNLIRRSGPFKAVQWSQIFPSHQVNELAIPNSYSRICGKIDPVSLVDRWFHSEKVI
jgi:hypothetical protein